MLVLSRRPTESVVINEDIVVTVVKIRGNQVHLAFQAPRETPIFRRELREANLGEPGYEAQPRTVVASRSGGRQQSSFRSSTT